MSYSKIYAIKNRELLSVYWCYRMAKFIASMSVVPIGTCSTSLSKFVAEVIKSYKSNNIKFELTPMATIIYGDTLDEILRAIKLAHDALRSLNIDRIVLHLNIDARHDKPDRMPEDKVKSVLSKISA